MRTNNNLNNLMHQKATKKLVGHLSFQTFYRSQEVQPKDVKETRRPFPGLDGIQSFKKDIKNLAHWQKISTKKTVNGKHRSFS